jgi:hypothetical protein
VESQPTNSSLRFSRALGGGIAGVKEGLGAFMWSTSPTDMLRLLPWPTALTGIVASWVRVVFLGDGGRGESPKESIFGNTHRGWVYMKLLPLAVASVRRGGRGFDMSDAVRMGAMRGDIGEASVVGDAGNGGTGGVVCAIRFDGADASVFCRRMGYVKDSGNDSANVLSVRELCLAFCL